MKHARKDYDRIQDPALGDPSLLGEGCSPIAEDEPVFLIRAKDKHFVPMVIDYITRTVKDPGGDLQTAEALSKHVVGALRWQEANGTKTADMPRATEGDGAGE